MELIKDIATTAGAITTIISFLLGINRITKGAILAWLQKPVLDELAEHRKQIQQLEINDLKQIIMNDNIPLSERVEARQEVY